MPNCSPIVNQIACLSKTRKQPRPFLRMSGGGHRLSRCCCASRQIRYPTNLVVNTQYVARQRTCRRSTSHKHYGPGRETSRYDRKSIPASHHVSVAFACDCLTCLSFVREQHPDISINGVLFLCCSKPAQFGDRRARSQIQPHKDQP